MGRHVTHLLTAYLHGELPPHLRAQVTRHTQNCDACYAALCRERELSRTLEARLRVLGAPHQEQLARVRAAVLVPHAPRRAGGRMSGLGLAAAVSLVLVMLLPMLVLPRAAARSLPDDQPSPQVLLATATMNVTDSPVMHVIASPTEVAFYQSAATRPPVLNPSPVPEVQEASGY